jgi:serine/threonine protein kinase
MELCEGKDLYAFSLNNIINPEDALDFSRQIAYGLFELHSLGLSHRDIKPENVFVKIGQNGSPILKIGDFGLARKSDFMSSIVGTVSYMGPELFNEYHTHKNSSCDIWALGCIIYELIEGK